MREDTEKTTNGLLKAIEANADKAAAAKTADDALKFSQASLNAAHAWITLVNALKT